MGYAKIKNLYADTRILGLPECYALEKVHGTSAHISCDDAGIRFFSGGIKHEDFVKLFDVDDLSVRMNALRFGGRLTIYGEAYGGKCQAMAHVYGPALRFVAFDVNHDGVWQSVPVAWTTAITAHLRFVRAVRIPTTMEAINAERDRNSYEGELVGLSEPGEGVVLRPLTEMVDERGDRICAKHKRDEFRETKTPRDPLSQEQIDANLTSHQLAREWATEMRMAHVIDKLTAAGVPMAVESIGAAIKAFEADVVVESAASGVEWSTAALRKLRTAAAHLYKAALAAKLTETDS